MEVVEAAETKPRPHQPFSARKSLAPQVTKVSSRSDAPGAARLVSFTARLVSFTVGLVSFTAYGSFV